MKQYIDLCKRILSDGEWITNKRTGKRCLTIINADFEYDCSDGTFPVLTTKSMAWKSAIAEMLGYLRGYNSAAQFRSIGCNTWNANANENESWLNNAFRSGKDDMGRAYGVQGRNWKNRLGETTDQLRNIYNNLCLGIDNRREILTFWNPGEMDQMCLPACMHTHQFSVVNKTLYLNSVQRSCDIPLGIPFNMIQCAWLLRIMAQITGLNPGIAFHKMINVHIYEDQIDLLKKQIKRKPYDQPELLINLDIKCLDDLEVLADPKKDFILIDYFFHSSISFPFSV